MGRTTMASVKPSSLKITSLFSRLLVCLGLGLIWGQTYFGTAGAMFDFSSGPSSLSSTVRSELTMRRVAIVCVDGWMFVGGYRAVRDESADQDMAAVSRALYETIK